MESKLPLALQIIGVLSMFGCIVFTFMFIWINEWFVLKALLTCLLTFVCLFTLDKFLMRES